MRIVLFLFGCIQLFTSPLLADGTKARLLVNIEEGTEFSASDFAQASSAYLVRIDLRNPFKALNTIFLSENYVVLSDSIKEKRKLQSLACRFGYRYISIHEKELKDALLIAEENLREGPKYSSEIPKLSREEGSALYDLMKKVDQIFTTNQIPYWAGGGTLLGAIRSGGIIPWDDDLDIYMLDVEEDRLLTLHGELENAGLGLYYSEENDFYKIFPLNGARIPNSSNLDDFLPYRYPFVDIFILLTRWKPIPSGLGGNLAPFLVALVPLFL